MPKQSISVEFKNLCEVVSVSCEISIEHDEVLNGGLSTFEIGNQIFYKAYPANTYTCYLSNGGTASVVSSCKIEEITEEIIFNGSKEATLSYPLAEAFTCNWIGSALLAELPHNKHTPEVIAKVGSSTLTIKEAVYGILSATYKYSFASIKFIPMHLGKQMLLVCRDCDDEEACAYMIEDIGDQAFEDVTLVINDACDNSLKVPGAQVEVNGELVELISGEDGKIHVGLLAKGTHSIKVTAPGYTSSDEDSLSNDEIIVG